MIRRQVGDEFWLFAQHDHALLSGKLAEHFGNDHFAAPARRESVIRGVSMHDSGWPLHDEQPTLNGHGQPLDVFETPPHVGLTVWAESSRRAAAVDPYAGMLVSLHGLSLSAFATQGTPFSHEKFDTNDPRVRFEVNKFQHAQVELQENLRRQVGLHTDRPLKNGLAEKSDDPLEQQLRFDFRLLQAMDKLSLCICCTKPPFEQVEPLDDRPGRATDPLRVERPSPHELLVAPWPFDVAEIALQIPYRIVPAQRFDDEQSFRAAFAAAPPRSLSVRVLPADR